MSSFPKGKTPETYFVDYVSKLLMHAFVGNVIILNKKFNPPIRDLLV